MGWVLDDVKELLLVLSGIITVLWLCAYILKTHTEEC